MEWWKLADCQYTDPEAFFSEYDRYYTKPKKICRGCPVRLECLTAAMSEEAPGADETPLANQENRFGFRAGLTAMQRWRLQYPGLVTA